MPEQLAQLAVVEQVVSLAQTWSSLGVELSQVVRHPLRTTWLSIAKLSCLVATDPEQAEAELIQLTYSRAEIRAVNPPALKLCQT